MSPVSSIKWELDHSIKHSARLVVSGHSCFEFFYICSVELFYTCESMYKVLSIHRESKELWNSFFSQMLAPECELFFLVVAPTLSQDPLRSGGSALWCAAISGARISESQFHSSAPFECLEFSFFIVRQ